NHADQRQHGTDGKIEISHDNDKRHTQSRDSRGRSFPKNTPQIGAGPETVVQDKHDSPQYNQNQYNNMSAYIDLFHFALSLPSNLPGIFHRLHAVENQRKNQNNANGQLLII